MTEEFAIYAHQLTKTFKTSRGSILAVDHLSFVVKPGETFGLIGPDGAGKSTTTRLMLGLLRRLHGRRAGGSRARQGVRRQRGGSLMKTILAVLAVALAWSLTGRGYFRPF